MARALTSPVCPTLVGRERSLAPVEQFLVGDSTRVLLTSGEVGIGRSRLMTETRQSAETAA